MQVKKVVAKDIRSALKAVREELGPNAIILSNTKRQGNVELLCTLDGAALDKGESSSAASDDDSAQEAIRATAMAKGQQEKQQGKVEPPSHLEREMDQMRREQIKKANEIALRLQSKAQRKKQAAKAPVFEMPGRELPRVEALRAEAPAPAAVIEEAYVEDYETPDEPFDMSFSADSMLATSMEDVVRDPGVSKENAEQETLEFRDEVERDTADRIDVWLNEASQASTQSDTRRLEEMSHELRNIWRLLQTQSQKNESYREEESPTRTMARNRLAQLGLRGRVIQQLLDTWDLEDVSDKRILQNLSSSIDVMPSDVVDRGGVFAFVGPAGVGKTTTIGKLAANYVLRHGADSVVLVTTDNYRIAAHESLKAYGRILKVPVKVHDNSQSLVGLLHVLRRNSLILIDTPGCGPHDPHLQQQMDMLRELEHRVQTFLVLPATAQQRVLDQSYSNYQAAGLSGCVVSKLDEAISMGEVLSLVIEKELPVAYSTHGQMVPDDIETASSAHLVRRAAMLSQIGRGEKDRKNRKTDNKTTNVRLQQKSLTANTV